MKMTPNLPTLKWPDGPRPRLWDEETLFMDGDTFFADLIAGIHRAQVSIRLETYIFAVGLLGDRVTSALIAAARRGVKVQVLVDGLGSPSFSRVYSPRLHGAGAAVRFYRMWPWQLEWLQGHWANFLYEFINRWLSINRGNHRKYCLIDDSVAWIGGFNIDDMHLHEVRGSKAWADVGVRVSGSELARLTQAFRAAFYNDVVQLPFHTRASLLFLNSSYILRKSTQHHLIRRLRKAQRRVWIQTPYFVPIGSLYRALRRLARRGGDVRIIVPAISDVPLVKFISYGFFLGLLKAGVRIFEYEPTFAHQKVMHIDDFSFVGSTNLNHRSFLHDLEVDVVITWQHNRDQLLNKFLQDQAASRELTRAGIEHLAWWHKAVSRVLLLLRYWS